MENRQRVSVAMRRDLETARATRYLSLPQVASLLALSERGGDYGASLLTKAVDCERKFPHWRIADWTMITGGEALISELARQSGGVFVAVPTEVAPVTSMLDTMHAFNVFAKSATAASKSNFAVPEHEAEAVSQQAFVAIAALLGMVNTIQRAARRKSKPQQFAASIAEASRNGNGSAASLDLERM